MKNNKTRMTIRAVLFGTVTRHSFGTEHRAPDHPCVRYSENSTRPVKAMKRVFWGVALLGVGITSAQAQSSVTLYGLVDAGFQFINDVGVAQNTGKAGRAVQYANQSRLSFQSGGEFGDRWGIKGTEDLGGGLAAIFRLENGFNIGTGALTSSDTEFNRQAFIGLSSNRYGTLTLGRQYEAITDLVEQYGPISFVSGVGTYPGDLSNFDNNVRVNNALKYVSPVFMGFTGEVLYGFGSVAGSLNTDSTFSTGFNYTNGPLGLGIAYLRMDNSGSTANAWNGSASSLFSSSINAGFAGARSAQIVDAAANYTVGALVLGLSYGFTQYRPSSVSLFSHSESFNSVGANIKYSVTPAWNVGAGYSFTRGPSVKGSVSSPQYQQVNLSSYYFLSKRTSLYILGGYQHAKGSTLDAYGNVVNATASIGDSANGFSSGSDNQLLVRVGIVSTF